MPLTIDNRLVENYKEVIPNAGGSFAVASMALIIGIPNWTEANIADVWARVSFVEALSGTFRTVSDGEKWQPLPFTQAEIKSLVGVRTNASSVTKAVFIKNQFSVHERDCLRMP